MAPDKGKPPRRVTLSLSRSFSPLSFLRDVLERLDGLIRETSEWAAHYETLENDPVRFIQAGPSPERSERAGDTVNKKKTGATSDTRLY